MLRTLVFLGLVGVVGCGQVDAMDAAAAGGGKVDDTAATRAAPEFQLRLVRSALNANIEWDAVSDPELYVSAYFGIAGHFEPEARATRPRPGLECKWNDVLLTGTAEQFLQANLEGWEEDAGDDEFVGAAANPFVVGDVVDGNEITVPLHAAGDEHALKTPNARLTLRFERVTDAARSSVAARPD